AQSTFPIGSWREHLPYEQMIQVGESNGLIWAATPYALVRIDPETNTLERKSRITGLAEGRISKIAVYEAGVVVAYTNSNIDILEGDKVHHVPDFFRSTISGDKTINNIFISGNEAYVSTGLGILVLDLEKKEISNTYIIGSNGNKSAVFAVTIFDSLLYAATGEGLKRMNQKTLNPADYASWETVSVSPAPGGIFSFSGQLFFHRNDSLFILSKDTARFIYSDGWNIVDANPLSGQLLLAETKGNTGRIVEITVEGMVTKILMDDRYTSSPGQATFFRNRYWIADSVSGLSFMQGAAFEREHINGPGAISSGEIRESKGIIWVAAGGVNSLWRPEGKPGGLFSYNGEGWTNFTANSNALPDSISDIISIAIDPVDQSVWAGSFGGGLMHISSANELQIYSQNSPLEPALFSPGKYFISGLAFDREGNLWISNYGSARPLVVKKKDNTWQKFSVPLPLVENGLSAIVIDAFNQKWIISPRGNGLLVFNHGESLSNTGDDRYKSFRMGTGAGNLPDDEVLSIAIDKNGFVWIGTANGIGIVQCPGEVFTPRQCETIRPVVSQGNFNGYLFEGQRVQAIAIDGANRKWIGTKNGVWLISPDGEKTIQRFTTDNSPLPDNDITAIAINSQTGEVFFSTAAGIYSYRSDATENTGSSNDLLIFPNPVPPGYTGTIGIRGVSANGIIKITTPDGRLVFQTNSLGGQAVWNGRDYRGRSVASGIYLVFETDELKKDRLAGKIVFISK
ncbi:MAG TPA: two-component regulator propeller domain-containing protein, partial [Flavitalea sp.]|nr:two-component regulator propeller domain-containing protein [Flavitalea sp.]